MVVIFKGRVRMLVCGTPKRMEQIINATEIGSKCESLLAHKGKMYLQIFLQACVGIIQTNVVHHYSKQPLRPLNVNSRHHDTRIP